MSSNNGYSDLRNQRVKEAKISRIIIITIIAVLLIVISAVGYFTYNYLSEGLSPVDPNDHTIKEIEIPLGSSVDQIGEILEEKDIIDNSTIFKYYVKFKNETGFQAGEYKLSSSMKMDNIIESLKTGKILVEPLFTVTIPEGTTIEEIAEIYDENTSIDGEEFLEMMTDESYIQSLVELYPGILNEEDILQEDIRYPLEGYLYAATYPFFEEDPTIEQVVEKMLQETQDRVMAYTVDIENMGLTYHEVITMASLIEEEAVGEEDRKMISGVFYNRMNREPEMPLQTDPTVLYALGEHKEQVLYEDLEVESPYNTYVNSGLPIGPISNFRENALQAALYPEEHDYLYFVAGYDGEVYYAETNEEHNQNIQEHRPPQD
ncbi:endolytic transglycosylase MltG [Aquisalibacillus elongatus]|uniref:Endolytic murein transglycosylase n=1 Tax=Aquisalibacillus elongatus TaxID=485577 RepID=A0A3N5BD30_9BACI|nr:endolytic transglycosylase MltG [Aquisalibacillus elongatus]RPF55544.1 UPF0755 protein [Aquisalibacillus elongatus]